MPRFSVQIPFFSEKKQGFLEKWLVIVWGRESMRVSPKCFIVPEAKKALKEAGTSLESSLNPEA